MKTAKSIRAVTSLLFASAVMFITVQGCQNDSINESSYLSEDEYLRTVAINSAYSNDTDDDDNLFASEIDDFDSEGAVEEQSAGTDVPIDSLLRWGRRIISVNVNAEITYTSDTVKKVEVTRTVSGNFIIIGFVNGQIDSAAKPYTQQQRRLVTFKRVNNRPNPRMNWRVYQYTAVDGQTTSPQTGKDNIVVNRVEYYRNNILVLTLNGPDFTSNIFTSRFFGGTGTFEVNRGDIVKAKVYLSSSQSDTDHVAYHWGRNSFGFHRERFALISQTPNGSGYDRVYEKEYTVYSMHHGGMHNGFISANTNKSLYDNDPALFSSTYLGFPYRVRH